MASGDVGDLLTWVNAEVAKLSGTGLAKMASVLKEAEKELTQDLAKWLGKVGGDTKFTAQVYRNALVQIRGALLSIEQRSPLVAQVLKFGATQASMLATKHLIAEVEKFSLIHEGSIRPVALEAATVLAEGKKTLWPHFNNSAKRYTGQVGEDIRRQLAIGMVRGETVDQLTSRLVKLGGPKGYVALRGQLGKPGAVAEHITEGLFARYRSWGERLVRTETVNAYNQLALDGISELNADDPGYKKRWDAAIDGRTCKYCFSYDHEVVDTDKNFHGGVQAPPLHPNCRCAVVLWRADWSETKELKRTKHGQYGPEEEFKPSVAPTPKAPKIPHSAPQVKTKAKAAPKNPTFVDGIPRNRRFKDGTETLVDPKDLMARGVDMLPNYGNDLVRVEGARQAMREGQREAIKIGVDKKGKLSIINGRHRLAAALELGIKIRVKWYG